MNSSRFSLRHAVRTSFSEERSFRPRRRSFYFEATSNHCPCRSRCSSRDRRGRTPISPTSRSSTGARRCASASTKLLGKRFCTNSTLPLLKEAGHHIEPTIRFDGTLDHNTQVVDFYVSAPVK